LPCSKGKSNAQGNICPYAEHEPQTIEGWEAWDIALRCAGQLRMTQFTVVGIDMGAALRIAEGLGYSTAPAASLLPACEDGMVTALNEKISTGLKA
jgi:hypothetical protein